MWCLPQVHVFQCLMLCQRGGTKSWEGSWPGQLAKLTKGMFVNIECHSQCIYWGELDWGDWALLEGRVYICQWIVSNSIEYHLLLLGFITLSHFFMSLFLLYLLLPIIIVIIIRFLLLNCFYLTPQVLPCYDSPIRPTKEEHGVSEQLQGT